MVAAFATAEHGRAVPFGRRSGCVAGAVALLAASPSRALEWNYTPGATIGVVRDTNILMQFGDTEPVNGRSVTGGVDVLGRNETFEFHATPRVDALRYDDPAVQDRDDLYADIGIAGHSARQRWSLGGSYANEGTRNSEFEANGFPAVDYDRTQTGLNTSWTRFGAHGQYDLAASSINVNYQDALLSPYRDYRYDLLNGSYTRVASERTRWAFNVALSQVTTARAGLTTSSVDARASWSHSFTEDLQLHVGLGTIQATVKNLPGSDRSAPALDFSVTKTWLRWRLTAGGGRQLQPDGQGSLVREDRVQLSSLRRMSERLSVGLVASKSQTKYFLGFYDRDYWQESVTVEWRFKRRWILNASVYDHGQQYTTLDLPKQTGVVSQFSISYRGG